MSELYASLLMLGATISLGSVATGLVANQFGLAASTSVSGASVEAGAAGIQVSFVFSTVSSTSGCPSFGGVPAGSVLAVTVFDYGSAAFRPVDVAVNGTSYFSANYPAVGPGDMATFRVTLAPKGACAHEWGQTVMMVDQDGVAFEFET